MCGEHPVHGEPVRNAPGIIPACAGSTVLDPERSWRWTGSSPHVRGAQSKRWRAHGSYRIIPACAGSTPRAGVRGSRSRDHPRMCGEHAWESEQKRDEWGSSPHVRGALDASGHVIHKPGIIPACAGSTTRPFRARRLTRDHPRMCGEHRGKRRRPRGGEGSSPHVRGAQMEKGGGQIALGIIPACAGSTNSSSTVPTYSSGSSPHVRGAQFFLHSSYIFVGIIPACAGSTLKLITDKVCFGDHPRMCGEHFTSASTTKTPTGSSPHVRGAPSARFIRRTRTRDHPRMCGEHRLRQTRVVLDAGIIPACAGSTPTESMTLWLPRDHPRMCGEH